MGKSKSRWSGPVEGETVVELTNGWKIATGPGDEYTAGGYVRVFDEEEEEVAYWAKDEWEEDPECVMGAILRCVAHQLRPGGTEELNPELGSDEQADD